MEHAADKGRMAATCRAPHAYALAWHELLPKWHAHSCHAQHADAVVPRLLRDAMLHVATPEQMPLDAAWKSAAQAVLEQPGADPLVSLAAIAYLRSLGKQDLLPLDAAWDSPATMRVPAHVRLQIALYGLGWDDAVRLDRWQRRVESCWVAITDADVATDPEAVVGAVCWNLKQDAPDMRTWYLGGIDALAARLADPWAASMLRGFSSTLRGRFVPWKPNSRYEGKLREQHGLDAWVHLRTAFASQPRRMLPTGFLAEVSSWTLPTTNASRGWAVMAYGNGANAAQIMRWALSTYDPEELARIGKELTECSADPSLRLAGLTAYQYAAFCGSTNWKTPSMWLTADTVTGGIIGTPALALLHAQARHVRISWALATGHQDQAMTARQELGDGFDQDQLQQLPRLSVQDQARQVERPAAPSGQQQADANAF